MSARSCDRAFGLVLVVLTILLTSAEPCKAQPYVGAAFVTDVVRTSGVSDDRAGSGEALGAQLRLGVPLTERWGSMSRSRERETSSGRRM